MRRDPLQDFIDFLKFLKANKVKFIVVGAHAMSYWGYTRATGDIDILVSPDEKNVEKLILALKEFGAPVKLFSKQDFQKLGTVFQIGVPPVRIDILNMIDGVDTERVFKTSVLGTLMGVKVRVIHLKELIKNKKSTGRAKDLSDVTELTRLKK